MTDPEHPPAGPAQPHAAGRTDPPANDDTPQTPEPGTASDSGSGDDPVGREKGLRRRAQDAETERDRLSTLVETYQRREVEAIAAESMTAPGDLWAADVTLDGLRDDGGAVDPERVRAAVAETLEARPHWGKRTTPRPDPSQGAREDATPRGPSWSDVLSGRRG